MTNSAFGASRADELLGALGEQLAAAGQQFDLVVIGGSALLALGLVKRTTRDVDVLAIAGPEGLIPADPLPSPLVDARDRVARDFGLLADWLNPGPTELLRFGLPDGFLSRVETRTYGPGADRPLRGPARPDPLQALRDGRPRRRSPRGRPQSARPDGG
jgi:hypothetical protein